MISDHRRGRLEISLDLCSTIEELSPCKRTWAMSRANISWNIFTEILAKLTASALVVEEKEGLVLTDLGRTLLHTIRELTASADFAVATVLPS